MFLGTNNQSCSYAYCSTAFIYSLCLLDVQLFSSKLTRMKYDSNLIEKCFFYKLNEILLNKKTTVQ
jgi:hypothetical protein